MLKKFFIITICVVAIVSVLGLNDRFNYDGFDRASDMVESSIDSVRADVAFIEVFGYICENYPLTDDGMYTVRYIHEDDTLYVSYVDKDGNEIEESFLMPSDVVGRKLLSILLPLRFGIPNFSIFFDEIIDGLNYIIHIFVLFYTVSQFALIIIFDSIGVALSVLRAVFYLLGF